MKVILTLCFCLALTLKISAQYQIFPILDTKIGAVLGGARVQLEEPYAADFVDAATAVKSITKVTEFKSVFPVFDRNYSRKIIQIGKKREDCPEFHSVKLAFSTNLSGEKIKQKYDNAESIMLDGNFDWMPDDPAPVFLWKSSNGKSWNNPTYHKIAVDFLKSKGISNPKVNIVKAVRIDLDADKKDEVILVGSYFQTENVWKSAFGDYSFILVRKIIGGKAQNILLKGNFNVSENNRGAVQIKHNVFAVLDLNGNGTMEIVIHSQFPETLRSEVYEIKNNRFAKVLEAGCGA